LSFWEFTPIKKAIVSRRDAKIAKVSFRRVFLGVLGDLGERKGFLAV
jgi:hypothetical protein